MKSNLKLAAAIGLFAFAGAVPAYAADAIATEEPPAPAPIAELPVASWAGPYAGVNLGYGFSGHTKDPANVGNPDFKTDGFKGSVFGGYNWQTDNFVYGAEAELGYNGNKGGDAVSASHSGIEGSLRARLGYAVSPDILLYGTAGGAAQSFSVLDANDSDKQTMFGWTAGVGSDIKITDNLFGRVEYRYTDYGSADFTTPLLGTRSVKSTDNRITFGVGMKF
jgi:outer membrane immunogenic protein